MFVTWLQSRDCVRLPWYSPSTLKPACLNRFQSSWRYSRLCASRDPRSFFFRGPSVSPLFHLRGSANLTPSSPRGNTARPFARLPAGDEHVVRNNEWTGSYYGCEHDTAVSRASVGVSGAACREADVRVTGLATLSGEVAS